MVALRKEVIKKENKKRIVFMFKLLLLMALVYINVEYRSWIDLENTPFSGMVRGVLFYLTTTLLVSSARIIIVYFYIRRKQLESSEDNAVLAINRLATVLNSAVLIGTLFLLVDLDWQTFFASFSLVAVATVLVTKDYISNIINGLIIMLSDRISLNDHVKIGAHTGKVVDITLSNVYLLGDAQHLIMIPNNTVFSADIINYTKKDIGYVEIDFEMKPGLLPNIGELEEQLITHMAPFDKVIVRDSYELRPVQVLSEKIVLQFRFALSKPALEQKQKMQYWVLKKVVDWITQYNVAQR